MRRKLLISLLGFGVVVTIPAQAQTSSTSTVIQYTYDAAGNRIKKESIGGIVLRTGNTDLSAIDTKKELVQHAPFITEVSPNPSNGKFFVFVKTESLELQNIEVHDALGQLVYEVKGVSANQHYVNISMHPKGIYYVKFFNGDELSVQKIVYQ